MRCYGDGIKNRLRLRPQWTTADAEELYDDGSENEAYHDNIRELQGGFREYAPLMNIISSELNKSIFEVSDALSCVPQTRESEKRLRGIVKNFVNKCRKLVGLLGCATSTDAYAPAAPMHLASSSHAASSSRVVGEDEEEYKEEDNEEEGGEEEGEDEEDDEERAEEEHEEEHKQSDEQEEYDNDYGPPPTETTHDKKSGKQPKKDWESSTPFHKPRPCLRKNKVDETRSKNNDDRTSKRERSK
ncbi:hypothetical protein ZWY2020_008794 [Hordeum vulgare]|nr:hypothetical protein ZWY2020_008794 [Hordeum vulgare]